MKPKDIAKRLEDLHLVGTSLASATKGIPDRVFLTSPRTVITYDEDRTVAQLELNTPDYDVRSDVENLLDLLMTAGVWLTIEDSPEALLGEVYLPKEAELTRKVVVGVPIVQVTYTIPLTENGDVSYTLTFTYAAERPLHGLSLFTKKRLTLLQMEKLLPYILRNDLGETPVLVRYTAKNALIHLTPNGLTDMIYVGNNHVWLISTADGRMGLDMERAKGEITITNSGYVLTVTLKDKTTLEVFM